MFALIASAFLCFVLKVADFFSWKRQMEIHREQLLKVAQRNAEFNAMTHYEVRTTPRVGPATIAAFKVELNKYYQRTNKEQI